MIPIPLAAWIVAGAGLYLATFTVLATLFFLVGTGLLGAFAHPFWQWWLYALWYSGNPVVRAWLEVSGVPAAILPLAVGGKHLVSPPPGSRLDIARKSGPRARRGAADPRHDRQLWPCPLGADGGGAGPVAGAEPVPRIGVRGKPRIIVRGRLWRGRGRRGL